MIDRMLARDLERVEQAERALAEEQAESAARQRCIERLSDDIVALRTRLAHAEQQGQQMREALDILVRACEAGAYVGKASPAVVQARSLLTPAPAAPTTKLIASDPSVTVPPTVQP